MIDYIFQLSIFHQIVIVWIALALVVFPFAVIFVAPYGRHTRKGWGPMMDNKLGWIIMELPALIVLPVLLAIGPIQQTPISAFLVGLYLLHYINRVFIYPLRIKTTGKKVPLTIVLFAFVFNIVNGLILGYHFGFEKAYSLEWFGDPIFIIGLFLFVIGVFVNTRSDTILIGLRTKDDKGYKIPLGFLFEYISCPNHFGEIMEWLGYAFMTWSLPGFSFAIWTAANLIPRAMNHHSWYITTFTEYPKSRKAVLPFIL
ncbi:MAG: 3-oxo-5-alpha-steroid 4-dehydrogenase 1 [Saprospiraceae bacterium]|jgi:3-oxo-5-alpha-steroid 4-dehydrogenase 1